MYRSTVVKKPRKNHKCDVCFGILDGRHVYEEWTWNGEFYTARTHEKCFKARVDNCQRCGEHHCDHSAEECLREAVTENIVDLTIHYVKRRPHDRSILQSTTGG